ncbi:glycine--tRNA ligase subunit beta [Ramlibacter sp. AN1015]|uniref:glycine--tRNA ligase subunit beta n=1 Tax=Ramlibacter sp. AN1015 TaxID=3133428 RepID=UPI0030BE1120
MKKTDNLLVELLVEELPPKALNSLGQAFADTLFEQLRTQGLATPESSPTAYASPRRLAAHVTALLAQAPDQAVSHKLMPVSVGLDANGNPTPALHKKLQALGCDASAVGQLRRAGEGKAQALFLDTQVRGATLAEGLQKALSEALARLPIPKVMTYQLADGWTDVKFVRPAHALVALYGSEVVPVRALGLAAGDTTQGHRFEAASRTVRIRHADAYAEVLAGEGAVIASFAARRADIVRQLAEAAAVVGGGARPIDDPALLDEVTALVERPNVLACSFEPDFLQVPQECLILTMKANQKYFPLLDAAGRLTNRFLVVSNIRPEDPSAVVEGNERVVRPRLADAKFFFEQDRKKPLSARVDGLARVVYHNKLGTQGERSQRVRQLAQVIGAQLGDDHLARQADLAASLSKADLLTDMVGEFPELQGTMGRYYALADGLDAEIADAIEDHYRPRFAGDQLPRGRTGLVVALADKLETLAGLFAIGQLPSGDKDPFALRRHALGVVRMLMERDLPLSPSELVVEAVGLFPQAPPETASLLSDFIYERLAGLLREQGYSAQETEAVLALKPGRLGEVARRLAAVRAFAALPEAPTLAAANKRIANILRKAEEPVQPQVDEALLCEPAERELHAQTLRIARQANAQFDAGDYTASLQTLAALRQPVDAFFDGVMVNAQDAALRRNRLGLLSVLHGAMNRVADLSRLAT